MACHEIAALRLGLMRVLGRNDETEREHELAELGAAAQAPGPLRTLTEAQNLATLKQLYETALGELAHKIAETAPGDPKLGYLRTLLVLTRKVELDLDQQIWNLTRLYTDLEKMHDFVHEIYPAE